MGTILREQNQIVLVKPETVYGTDASPNGANAIRVSNINVKPALDYAERNNITGMLGAQGAIVVGKKVELDFELELSASGTAGTAPYYSAVLRACGLAEVVDATAGTVSYTPVDTAFESVTLYWRTDGLQYAVTGARGNVEVVLDNKNIPKLKVTMKGIYSTPTDASATPVNVDFSGVQNPVGVMNDTVTALSIYGQSLEMASLAVNLGNDVVHTQLVNAESVDIIGRKGTVNAQGRTSREQMITMMQTAEQNAYGALSIELGTLAGSIVRVDVPQMQLTSTPELSWTDSQGYISLSADIVPNARNNDLTLTFK